jgi:hypothetical protein
LALLCLQLLTTISRDASNFPGGLPDTSCMPGSTAHALVEAMLLAYSTTLHQSINKFINQLIN